MAGRLLGTWGQEQRLILIENIKKIHSIFESIWFPGGHQGLCLYQPGAHSHFLQVRGRSRETALPAHVVQPRFKPASLFSSP